MTARPFPDRANLTICFAHVAYRLGERFAVRKTGVRAIEVRGFDDFSARIPEADVVVVSGLWRNELIKPATKLRFIQSIGAGVDQFDRDALRARDIRLASAQGVNERAVSQHAMALILALMRHIPAGRDNQRRRHWRGMISDLTQREDELGGKTLLIVGLGRIGSRLATLARAFGLRVIATKRDPSKGSDAADLVVPDAKLGEVLPQADIVALTCPLTPQTEKLIGQAALAAMKPSAYLINVARGRVVDEPALIAALNAGRIAGAALDCTVEEPLPESSPLWDFDNVLITPHTAGETRRYEDNVLDILLENLERLWRGETELKNQIV
jgi:phosphoglycerate dehydrogenase-like enzyme